MTEKKEFTPRTKEEINKTFISHLAPYSPDGNGVKEGTPLSALVKAAVEEIHTVHKEKKEILDLIGAKGGLVKMIADDLWQRLQKKNDIEKGEFIDSLRSI